MNDKVRLYEIFDGEQLKIAELIQRRRLQLLVHSCIRYELGSSIISDEDWFKWALELKRLQHDYPDIEIKVPFREGFENWDGDTGKFLPTAQDWVINKARELLSKSLDSTGTRVSVTTQVKKTSAKRKLF